jgi:predicted alpha/beta hydrolase
MQRHDDDGRAETIPATDDLPLHGRVYEPESGADATVLALPGVGVPQRVFRHIGAWLARRGLRTVSIDYRGIRGSGGRAGARTATLTRWARNDAVGALRHVEATYGGPTLLLAHSFAGQMLGLAPALRRAEAVVTAGTGFGSPRYFQGRMRAFVTASWYLTIPACVALVGRVPAAIGVGEPIPGGVAREWAQWGRADDWLLSCEQDADRCFAAFDRPILALRATDDAIAPELAEAAWLRTLAGAHVTAQAWTPSAVGVPSLGHFGLLRPAAATRVWPNVLSHFRAALSRTVPTTDKRNIVPSSVTPA